MNEEFLFIVDTDQYAGNFEMEMAAYLIGMVFARGDKFADLYAKDTGEEDESRFADIVGIHESDGEHEPTFVAIWPTPGWFNNGLGGHFREGQEEQAKEHYAKACLKEANNKNVHPSDQKRHKKEWEKRGEEPLHKYPAFQSVAILFTERPSKADIKFLKDRALAFPEKYNKLSYDKTEITVTGFRLLKKTTTHTEEAI